LITTTRARIDRDCVLRAAAAAAAARSRRRQPIVTRQRQARQSVSLRSKPAAARGRPALVTVMSDTWQAAGGAAGRTRNLHRWEGCVLARPPVRHVGHDAGRGAVQSPPSWRASSITHAAGSAASGGAPNDVIRAAVARAHVQQPRPLNHETEGSAALPRVAGAGVVPAAGRGRGHGCARACLGAGNQ